MSILAELKDKQLLFKAAIKSHSLREKQLMEAVSSLEVELRQEEAMKTRVESEIRDIKASINRLKDKATVDEIEYLSLIFGDKAELLSDVNNNVKALLESIQKQKDEFLINRRKIRHFDELQSKNHRKISLRKDDDRIEESRISRIEGGINV